MSVPFRVTAVFSTTKEVQEDNLDPIARVKDGQIELRHISCAGGRCTLDEGTWEDRAGDNHKGYRIRCTVCGDTSTVRPIISLVQQIRRAVLDNESTSYGGWVDMQGNAARGEASKSGTSKPAALILEPELVRLHFADGSTRDMMAARHILRHGGNKQTYLYDADEKEVAVYAAGVVQAIEALRAYPRDDA